MNASISVVCYKSKTLSNGEHSLMLRVTKDRKPMYVSLSISIHPDNWDFTKNEPKPKCPNKDIINKIILDKKTEYQKEILILYWKQKIRKQLSVYNFILFAGYITNVSKQKQHPTSPT